MLGRRGSECSPMATRLGPTAREVAVRRRTPRLALVRDSQGTLGLRTSCNKKKKVSLL